MKNGQKWCDVVSPSCDDAWGRADPRSLEPYSESGTPFEIKLDTGRLATGVLWVDSFTIGGREIPKVPFGIPDLSNLDTNFLGLGFAESEAGPNKYPNLPQLMKKNELTKINAYSIWLDKKSERNGLILFGGYDQAKHTGRLAHLNMQPMNGEFSDTFVPMKAVSFGQVKETLGATILDLGSQLTLIPGAFAEDVAKAVGATKDEESHYIIDCDLSDEVKKMTMVVDFGDVKITLLAEDLVLPQKVGEATGISPGKCIWGVFPTNGPPILGNNFLRRAYVVFDLDHKIVSIAQTAYTHDSNGFEIPEDGLQALGDKIGTGAPDPELEMIAGDTESGHEAAETPDTMLGSPNNEAIKTGMTEETPGMTEGVTNSALTAAGTEPSLMGNTQGMQEPTRIEASTFNLGGSEQMTAKLPSLFSGTEQTSENGITNQQQQAGEYFQTTANSPTLDPSQDTTSTNPLNTFRYNAASNLFPNPPSTETPGGSSNTEPPSIGTTTAISPNNQAFLPATPGTSLLGNNQGPGAELASTPAGGGAGAGGDENLFLSTNAA